MPMSLDDVADIIRKLHVAFPHIEVREERVLLWHECLKDLEPNDAREALRQYLLEETRYPAIADIYQRAVKIREKREKAEKAKRDAAIVEEIRKRERERIQREIAEGVYDPAKWQVGKQHGASDSASTRGIQ